MAVRKIYLSLPEYPYVKEVSVTFPWMNGSKHQNVQAVLDTFHDVYPDVPALEVSLASSQPEGIHAAAMKLPLHRDGLEQEVPVGIVYEAAKVFENGGPYVDLLQCSRQKVQKDARLQHSGRCIGYRLEDTAFPVEPYPYAFFNWLYGCALHQNPEKAEGLLKFGAFSDLELGSTKKDRNSPARAAAVYAGLAAAGKLDCLASYEAFTAQTCIEPVPQTSAPEAEEPKAALPEPAHTPAAAPAQETAVEPDAEQPAPAAETAETAPDTEAEEPDAVPALETPAEEETLPTEPQPLVDGIAVPTVEQMKEISYAPKVKNLLISMAKNAGCSAKTAAGVVKIGRGLLLTSYEKALEEGALVINPEKNKVTFPLENPENGFHTIGQLTRCPVFVHGWKLNYQSCEPVPVQEEPEPTPPAYPTAEEYLCSHGYTITQQVRPEDLPPLAVQKLAWETGEAMRDPTAAAFLQSVRSHLQFHESFTFRMPKEAVTASRELVVALAQSWDHLGLFSECNAVTSRITCKLASENETVRSFASGHWLELYVVHSVQKVLDRWKTEQNAAVSLCSNVILSDSPEVSSAHELDVVFSVNGVFFWIEAKSSSRNINYGKYADLCTKLQVTPDQLLLVNSDLSEEDCSGISYFWPYRIANCATMEQKLEEMIQKQLESTGEAVPESGRPTGNNE